MPYDPAVAPEDAAPIETTSAAPAGERDLLRFLTCGSVDDGKSTLIGRLLYDSRALLDDQVEALERDSARGAAGGEIDFSLLVDGLAAEREQGITIDVAYRFFATPARKFIVADTPGHEQYTRNMATGASTADAAVLLIDARKGVLVQTRRHSAIVSLLGIRQVVLAVNKMDLVGFDQGVFDGIVADYLAFARDLGFTAVHAVPLSAKGGDNVAERSAGTPWYGGPTLLQLLEALPTAADPVDAPFRMAVQRVVRPNLDFRGYAGLITSGQVAAGDRVRLAPSGREAVVARIVTFDGDLPVARAGQSVTLTLDREIDISRGDLFADPLAPATVADQVEAQLVWMAEAPLKPEGAYLLKMGAQTVTAHVSAPKWRTDVNTLERQPAETLELNGIGAVELRLDRPIAFDPYLDSRDTGGFILIDRLSNATVAAGMARLAVRRATDVHWQAVDVDGRARAAAKGQRPRVVWLTGLSGAGKSTIANLVEKRLHAHGRHTYLLDGDNLRHGLNRDLGFSEADRAENIRRTAAVARLMTDAGLIVLVSLISPFRADRDAARAAFALGEFVEVFVDTSLAEAERRDRKGLYAKARAGEIRGFTGIDSPYEPPLTPELRLDTAVLTPEGAAEAVVAYLERVEEPGDYEI